MRFERTLRGYERMVSRMERAQARESLISVSRSWQIQRFLPLAVLSLLTGGAMWAGLAVDGPAIQQGSLTDDEFSFASDIARTETKKLAESEGDVSSAFATITHGTRPQSNTGHACLSRRLLTVTLVGTFPEIVTTGPSPGDPINGDYTVHAVVLTADPQTEEVCEIGVRVGNVAPPEASDAILFKH